MSDEMTLERRGSTPNPDPTLLTSEALAREVKALKELLELRLEGEETARVTSCKTLTSTIALQTELRDKGLLSIHREMELVERNRVEQKADTLASVAAALTAQKEAVKEQTTASGLSIAKSENATNEQLKQLSATFNTAIEGLLRSISDLKERVGTSEQTLATHAAQQSGEGEGQEKNQGLVFNIIMGMVAIGSLVIAFVAR